MVDDVNRYLTPNTSLDPTVALTAAQAAAGQANPQLSGSAAVQGFGIEYNIPTAIRNAGPSPIVASDAPNSAGVTNPVGTGTGTGTGGTTTGGSSGGSAATTPAGSDTQIQYNNSGSFGADSNLRWDKSSFTLTVGPEIGRAHV